jgi:hypothetical protein
MPSPTLIAEATRRSGVLWLGRAGEPPALVWHLWHDGSAYVLGGGQEQALPVSAGDEAVVVVRSKASQSGVVVSWPADVTAVGPGTELWAEVFPLLGAERLNAPAGADLRWAEECVVLRLTPGSRPTSGRRIRPTAIGTTDP